MVHTFPKYLKRPIFFYSSAFLWDIANVNKYWAPFAAQYHQVDQLDQTCVPLTIKSTPHSPPGYELDYSNPIAPPPTALPSRNKDPFGSLLSTQPWWPGERGSYPMLGWLLQGLCLWNHQWPVKKLDQLCAFSCHAAVLTAGSWSYTKIYAALANILYCSTHL